VALLLGAGLAGGAAGGAAPVVLTDSTRTINLVPHLEILRDPGGALEMAEVCAEEEAGRFRPSGGQYFFGFTDDAIWVRTAVRAETTRPRTWFFELAHARFEEVDWHVVRGGRPAEHFADGNRNPRDPAAVNSRFPARALELAPGETVELYLRVRTPMVVETPLAVYSSKEYVAYTVGYALFHMFGLGGLAMLLATGVIYAVFTKDRGYWAYAAAIGFVTLYFLGLTGYWRQLEWPGWRFGQGRGTLLVNALSVTNVSGRHVLLGHMDRVAEELRGRVRLVVVCRSEMAALRAGLGDRADLEIAPAATHGWLARALWERAHLAGLVRKHAAFAYFTPSGLAAHGLDVPQIVFCQNPWALVPAARRWHDAPKAWLQRRAYRRAMRAADVLVFNSRYMQEAYRANAGFQEKRGLVVYQAAADATRARAAAAAGIPRKPGQILCTSVMAPHKNAETLVRALREVRTACPEARLVFAGSWPDAAYERKIRALVAALGMDAAVEFAGFVEREALDRLYAESRVFCLMSRCESFGIPAVEAQLFGTPVVSSTVCAIPEICGRGGVFCDPDDVPGVAAALRLLLQDAAEWARLSAAARVNAERFAWSRCSRSLVECLVEVAEQCGASQLIP